MRRREARTATAGSYSGTSSWVAALAAVLLAITLTTALAHPAPGGSRLVEYAAPTATQGGELPGKVDCRVAKCIALTFDGGPGQYTSRLLSILRKKQVHVTFFLLGRRHVERHPELVRRIHREGHEVANHTWTHRRLTDLGIDEIHDELSRTQRAIERLTGERPRLMRPPQGYTDPRVARIADSLGLAQVLWTVTAKDYATRYSDLIVRRVVAGARRNGIILLHDIYGGTVPAVPTIIDRLERRGFTVVGVSDLFAPGSPHPGRTYRDAWVVR